MKIGKIRLLGYSVGAVILAFFLGIWSIHENFEDMIASFEEWQDFRKRRLEWRRLSYITRWQYTSDSIGDFMDLIMEGVFFNILSSIIGITFAPFAFGYMTWRRPELFLQE